MARKKSSNVSFSAIQIPEAGQRVGSICGPGESATDNAGTVMCQVTNVWGTHAMVMMDSGEIKRCDGLTTYPYNVGIGWHLIPAKDAK